MYVCMYVFFFSLSNLLPYTSSLICSSTTNNRKIKDVQLKENQTYINEPLLGISTHSAYNRRPKDDSNILKIKTNNLNNQKI